VCSVRFGRSLRRLLPVVAVLLTALTACAYFNTLAWRSRVEREARIATRSEDGSSLTLVEYTGDWATVRLLERAAWQGETTGAHRVTWSVITGSVSAELRFPGGIPAFDPSLYQGLSCEPRVVR